MHYDVKDDRDQEICKVILDHKIEEYGLGDGATLRILAMQWYFAYVDNYLKAQQNK